MPGRVRKIQILTSGGLAEVVAYVAGEWAAHPTHNGLGYGVTHVPTGLSTNQLAADLSPNEAIAIAGSLCRRMPRYEHFKGSDDTEIVMATIAEVLAEGSAP